MSFSNYLMVLLILVSYATANFDHQYLLLGPYTLNFRSHFYAKIKYIFDLPTYFIFKFYDSKNSPYLLLKDLKDILKEKPHSKV